LPILGGFPSILSLSSCYVGKEASEARSEEGRHIVYAAEIFAAQVDDAKVVEWMDSGLVVGRNAELSTKMEHGIVMRGICSPRLVEENHRAGNARTAVIVEAWPGNKLAISRLEPEYFYQIFLTDDLSQLAVKLRWLQSFIKLEITLAADPCTVEYRANEDSEPTIMNHHPSGLHKVPW
jgi:hypothetical protein